VDFERYIKRALEMEHFFPGDFKRYIKRALWVEHLSLHRGPINGTWRGVHSLGTLEVCKEDFGGGTSFSV
jgi:hypothetical protein